jgi:apolipoprotein N-acyltransferase
MAEQTSIAAREPESLSPLARLAVWLSHCNGWRRAGVATGLGILACFALPPFDLVPLLIPAFTGLLWLIVGCRTTKSAYWTGWWFGMGLFVPGLYWISNAMLVDVGRFWWAVPFALLGLPALIGFLYGGPVTALLHRSRASGIAQALMFAGLWTGAEYLRGHLLTGFPWNLIGYSWDGVAPMRQAAAWVGAYGVSLITALAAAMPAALIDPLRAEGIRKSGAIGLAAVTLGLAVIAGAGAIRLSHATDEMAQEVTLRIVQPNIAQNLKWDPRAAMANFRKILELSARPAAKPLTAILWPESAIAFLAGEDAGVGEDVTQALPGNHLLLTGTARRTHGPDGADHWSVGMVALDDRGQQIAAYDKFHLVPFGEYVPMKNILPIAKLTPGAAPFEPGPGPRTLALPGLPLVGPLICYEVIFPGAVVDQANRPKWLLNLTNDAWYGYSTGPFQHFVQSAWRGVEEGVPLVRVANTGISGVVDPYGRIIARLGLDETGIIDASLPVALPESTFYARYNDLPVLSGVIALLLAAELLRRRRHV